MHSGMKLGRIRPTPKQRALAPKLRDFLTAPLPPAPEEFHGSNGAAIGLWGNDTCGDCVVAGAASYRAIRAAMLKQPDPPSTTDAVVAQYFKLTNGHDIGLNECEFLDAAKAGVELGGPVWMDALWTTVDDSNESTIRSLISIFGAVYVGLDLPLDAKSQTIWTPTAGDGGAPGGWGGHCALRSGWNKAGLVDYVTWGYVVQATPDWPPKYETERHVIVDADSAAVAGIDFEKLAAYAQAVGQ